jgi:hypothetical protein
MGPLMQGLPVAMKTGVNHTEYVDAMLASLAVALQKAEQTMKVDPATIEGLDNVVQHIAAHIQIISQDPEQAPRVKVYMKQLNTFMGILKKMSQSVAQQMQAQAQQNGNGAPDPKDVQKLQAQQAMDAAKLANTRESHAQRTVQRQLQFERQLQQDQAKAQAELEKTAAQAKLDLEIAAEQAKIDLAAEQIKNQMKAQQAKKKPTE